MSIINVGYDASGNGNNWTPTNLDQNTSGTGADVLVDVPTPWGTDTGVGGEVRGNYATLNPLDKNDCTLSNGNLTCTTPTGSQNGSKATFYLTSGKWYWEYYCAATSGTNQNEYWAGISNSASNYTIVYYGISGDTYINGGSGVSGTSYTTGDTIGVALDMDNKEITFYSKTGVAQTTRTISSSDAFAPWFSDGTSNGSVTYDVNFGQRPFARTAPSGFASLCTQNLPEPTVVDGGDYFDVSLWTGTGTTNAITGLAYQPSWVWIKNRGTVQSHLLVDAVRGANKGLQSNTSNAETTITDGRFTSFDANGFTVAADDLQTNYTGDSFVGWSWKANGAGVSNTDGTITSTVSANTTAGFSIVTYTGTGADATVGHGLGATPSMIIVKNRSISASWFVYHTSLGKNKYVLLDTTGAAATDTDTWNDTAPTSTVFSLGGQFQTDGSGNSLVAYCFAAVPGFSAFGSYTGNGSTDGPFVYTGFRPAFILTKRTDSTSDWWLMDDDRLGYNGTGAVLKANADYAEASNTTWTVVDQLSNGFKIRYNDSDNNANGGTYIYAAFAENPFKYALAR